MKLLRPALYLAAGLAFLHPAVAAPWDLAMDSQVTLSQSDYSANWDGGESGAVVWAVNLNSSARKQLTPKLKLRSTLKLAFGQTHNQSTDTRAWLPPVKSTDLVDLETLLRMKVGLPVEPFSAVRIETFFLDSRAPNSQITLNPVKLTGSIGATRVFIQDDNREVSARLGFGVRQHLDRNALLDVATGRRGSRNTYDGGLEFVTDLATPLAGERLSLTSKLVLFQALLYSEADKLQEQPGEDYWRQLDAAWENIFTANITGYLMVNLYLQWLYDREIDAAGRLKQTLGLGIGYKVM